MSLDWADEAGSFTAGLFTADRSDNVLTGTPRDLYDWAFDYEGTWGGMEDQHDILGPSLDPRDLGTSDDDPVIDWRSEQSQENDPTAPSNLPISYKWIIYGIVALGVLYVASPALELGAALAEE